MNKKFKNALRPDLKVRRTGLMGMGRIIEVSSADGTLNYRVDRIQANEQTAATLNSRIPIAVVRPPN